MEAAVMPQELPAGVAIALYFAGFVLLATLLVLGFSAATAPSRRRREERTQADRQQAKENRQRRALEYLGATAEAPEDRHAEQLVLRGAGMLGVSGGWQNRTAARQVYDELLAMPRRVSEPALLRALVRHPGNRQIVFLAVRLGRPAPARLLRALEITRDHEIALHFLNTEVPGLIDPASAWCRQHGYAIQTRERPGSRSLTWGQF